MRQLPQQAQRVIKMIVTVLAIVQCGLSCTSRAATDDTVAEQVMRS